jgi:hypothetical protein
VNRSRLHGLLLKIGCVVSNLVLQIQIGRMLVQLHSLCQSAKAKNLPLTGDGGRLAVKILPIRNERIAVSSKTILIPHMEGEGAVLIGSDCRRVGRQLLGEH